MEMWGWKGPEGNKYQSSSDKRGMDVSALDLWRPRGYAAIPVRIDATIWVSVVFS